MANFKDSPHFATHDDYYTKKTTWELIEPFLKEKGYNKIWECCLLGSNEQSVEYLQDMDFNVLGNKNVDFLNENTWSSEMTNKEYDCLVSNPPFDRIVSFQKRRESKKFRILEKALQQDKPFVFLLNSTNIQQKWFMDLFVNKDIKFLFPSYKLQYDKYKEGGSEKIPAGKGASFNSVFLTYKVLDQNMWV